jgi:hypothetical protein
VRRALTDPAGETASLLRRLGVLVIARLDAREDINCRLREFVAGLRTGGISVCSDATLHTFRRTEQAHEYARLCDAIAENDTWA